MTTDTRADHDEVMERGNTIGSIPEPKLYPDGTWKLRALSGKVTTKEDDEDVKVVNIAVVGTEPQDDVDATELQEAEGLYEGTRIFVRRYIETANDKYQLGKLLKAFGFGDEDDLYASVRAIKGHEAFGKVGRRSYKRKGSDETTVENTVSNIIPLD